MDMNCIILDDDRIVHKIIVELIKQTEGLNLIASCYSAKEAFAVLHKNQIDLIFLDIQMSEMSGFEFLKGLSQRPITIVISSQRKYAIESYDYNVIDFLLKPVNLKRFHRAVQRAKLLMELKESSVKVQQKDFIFVKDRSIMQKIPLQNIWWVESQGDYVKIKTVEKFHMAHISLTNIGDKLKFLGFLRVHRRFIVSLDKIEHIEDNTIVMKSKLIPVSESYRGSLKKNLMII